MTCELQHPDPPTWCIWCGTFSCYLPDECSVPHVGEPRFDNRNGNNVIRVIRDLFGPVTDDTTE